MLQFVMGSRWATEFISLVRGRQSCLYCRGNNTARPWSIEEAGLKWQKDTGVVILGWLPWFSRQLKSCHGLLEEHKWKVRWLFVLHNQAFPFPEMSMRKVLEGWVWFDGLSETGWRTQGWAVDKTSFFVGPIEPNLSGIEGCILGCYAQRYAIFGCLLWVYTVIIQ